MCFILIKYHVCYGLIIIIIIYTNNIYSCYQVIVFHFMHYFLCILLVLISIYHVQIGSTAFREGEIIIRGDPCATEKSLCRSRHFVNMA